MINSQVMMLSALLTSQPPITLRKIPGTHFCQRLTQSQGIVRLEGLGKLENPVTLSGI
jgi:hypothetical protein